MKTTAPKHQNLLLLGLFILMMWFGPLPLRAQSGAVDLSFNPGTGTDLTVYALALQTNGQILIAGDFTSFNDDEIINVTRLNTDGSRDTNFVSGADDGASYSYVDAVALLPGGQILVGGSFTNAAGTNFARLNTNGSLDTGFSAITDDTVNAIALQTNGSIVIGGFFTRVDGRPRNGIARVGSGGSLDLGFNPGVSGSLATVYALALQTDGKIVIGGAFTSANNNSRTNIARLNTDGTLDMSFKPVSIGGGQLAPASFYALAIDSQGRVTVGGDFTSVNGQTRANLARFLNDGSLDTNFNASAGTDFAVNSVVVQYDGRILLGGFFNQVNGTAQNYFARLNDDGSLDRSFNTGDGAGDVVWAAALQSNGKILVGGSFANFNGAPLSGIARLQNPPPLFNPVFSNNTFKVSIATLLGRSYILEFKNSLSDSSWTALPAVAGDGTIKGLTDPAATGLRRFYRVEVQ